MHQEPHHAAAAAAAASYNEKVASRVHAEGGTCQEHCQCGRFRYTVRASAKAGEAMKMGDQIHTCH